MNYFKFLFKSLFRRFSSKYQKNENSVILDRILEVKNEEVVAEISIKNAQVRVESIGLSPDSEEAELYLKGSKPAYLDPSFGDVKFKKKARKITYTLSTNQGELLYRGDKLRIFMKEKGLDKEFSFSSIYNFAVRYQGERVFKGKYIITFEEK